MKDVLIYAFGWLTFGIVHSLFARLPVQQMLEPRFKGSYRLIYNIISLLHILLVFAIGRTILDSHTFTPIASDGLLMLMSVTKLFGYAIVVLSLIKYDLGRFSGLTQIKTREYLSVDTHETLQLSGLNKWVRHPLYSGAFLALWGGASTSFGLWTAIFGSIYLLIGTALEERKLIHFYGDAYRQYQAEVSRYFPTRWWRTNSAR